MAANNPDLKELGTTGLARFNGEIFEEFLPELRGPRWRKIVRQMIDNDSITGSLLFAIETLARTVKWNIVPKSEKNEDKQVAEFFKQALFEDQSQTWDDTLSEILSFLPWGWSNLEILYKRRGGDVNDPTKRSRFTDGKIGWRRWSIRSQETLDRWQFDDDGGIQAMQQIAPPDYQQRTIPINKSLLFRTKARKGSPEGQSILRTAYVPWYFKTNIMRIEGVGIERDLAGLPTAWVPPQLLSSTATAEEQSILAAIKKLVTGIKRDEQEGVIMPLAYDENGNKLYDLTLMNSGGQRQFDTDKIITRYEVRQLISCLADFILLGHDKVGSFALSTNKTGLFTLAMGSYLDSIADVINRHAFTRLAKYNGFPAESVPTLQHDAIENVDLGELGTYVKVLNDAGALLFPTADGKMERYLQSQAGLPVPDEEQAQKNNQSGNGKQSPSNDEEADDTEDEE